MYLLIHVPMPSKVACPGLSVSSMNSFCRGATQVALPPNSVRVETSRGLSDIVYPGIYID